MTRYYRCVTDKKLAGLCGGLGELLGVDPTAIRLGMVFLAICTGILPLLVTYIVAWLIVPVAPGGPAGQDYRQVR